MKKKLLYFLVVALTGCFAACTSDSQMKEDVNVPIDSKGDARTVNEAHSLAIVDKLSSTVINSGARSLDVSYASFYGGSYIDDLGKLIVFVKEDIDNVREQLYEIVGSSDFTVKKCKYSLNELKAVKEKLVEKMRDEKLASSIGWESLGIRISENKVTIGIRGYSEERVKAFKREVLDSDMLMFYPLLMNDDSICMPEPVDKSFGQHNIKMNDDSICMPEPVSKSENKIKKDSRAVTVEELHPGGKFQVTIDGGNFSGTFGFPAKKMEWQEW